MCYHSVFQRSVILLCVYTETVLTLALVRFREQWALAYLLGPYVTHIATVPVRLQRGCTSTVEHGTLSP